MKNLILNQSVKIINGDDFGKDGIAVRLVDADGKTLVVVQFSYREYGIYKISDVEITVCC